MAIGITQVLDLVGKLDDSPGEDTPRERFRRYLQQNVTEVGQVRDYVQECLRNKGDEYSRALQDLVNHLGRFLGFEVTFGRYRGVPAEIGFDGLWSSPTGFWIVVEVKSSEVHAKTAPLLSYMAELISAKQIPHEDLALGLYAVGRPDPEINQLENAIVAEKNTGRLRIISVESLLSLAEMANEYDVTHEEALWSEFEPQSWQSAYDTSSYPTCEFLVSAKGWDGVNWSNTWVVKIKIVRDEPLV